MAARSQRVRRERTSYDQDQHHRACHGRRSRPFGPGFRADERDRRDSRVGFSRRHLRLDARHRRHLYGSGRNGLLDRAGGSAAAVDGKAQSRTNISRGNGPNLNANAKAQAHDGGTFSKSHTKTKVKAGEEVSSRTRTMSHVPGSKPVKSTSSVTTR
jgi:hypothetical protein